VIDTVAILGKFKTHSDFINDIIRYVDWYKWIITEEFFDNLTLDAYKNIEIKELLRNIFHDIKAEAFKPFVLGILEYHQSGINNVKICDDLLLSILKTIRTYLIRRRILGLTQGENKNIVSLSNRIEEIATGKRLMVEYLSNMFYRLRFPNNNEIRNFLITKNFYEGLKKYSKFILGKIEENNTKVSVDFRNPKITIEHIMPQILSDWWEKELGSDFFNLHKTYLHNIGNLILTEFNSEMGNKTFEEKKEKLKASSLNYRLSVINKKCWNESSINEHQENMINWFLETFSLPESYRFESNWNTTVTESKTFSPLDNDAGDVAEGNKPVELRINDNIIKVKTWQDVFLKFIDYARKGKNVDFDYILQNQIEMFNRDDTIISWHRLKEIIDKKIELTDRYKNINGKTWEKVTNLNDDEIFIHINISAYSCMMRIANIMNKFNFSSSDVEINLK